MAKHADLKLDPITNDLVIPLQYVEDIEAIQQSLRVRLSTRLGDFPFNVVDYGIDFLGDIFVKAPNLRVIGSIIKEQVLRTQGVTGIQEFKIDLDTEIRSLVVSFNALTDLGTIQVQSATPSLEAVKSVLRREGLDGYVRLLRGRDLGGIADIVESLGWKSFNTVTGLESIREPISIPALQSTTWVFTSAIY